MKEEEIYDSEEDYEHDVHAVNAARFEDAVERRRVELAGGSDSE